MERQETKVYVRVLIFEKLFKQALEEYNKKNAENPATGFKTAYDIGYVQTNDGKVFVLDTEGCGPSKPVTKANPAEIELYPVQGFVPGPASPAFTARLTDEDILKLPIEPEPIELSRFIRRFGRRLESNFYAWKEQLAPLV